MTEKELEKACAWLKEKAELYAELDYYDDYANSADEDVCKPCVRFDTDKFLADFRNAVTEPEPERIVTINGKRYRIKELTPTYCHCEKCAFIKPCGCLEYDTTPCHTHSLGDTEYFDAVE